MVGIEELEKLEENTKEAIKWVAAESKYASDLVKELEEIKGEKDPEKAEKEIRNAERIFRWIGRGEYRMDEFEKRIIEGLKELSKIVPLELKKPLEGYLEHLRVAEGMLVKAASRFTSDIRKKLGRMEKDAHLERGLDPETHQKIIERVKHKLKEEAEEVEKGVKKLKEWVESSQAILVEEIQPFVERLEKMAA